MKALLIVSFLFSSLFCLGQFGPKQRLTVNPHGVESIDAGDLDADGDIDIVAACRNPIGKVTWYENLGGGIYALEKVISSPAMQTEVVQLYDIDNDGDLDVFFTTSGVNSVSWCENLGGGDFGPDQLIGSALNGGNRLYVADLDGDGDGDVLSDRISATELIWYENTGGGNWAPAALIADQLPSLINVLGVGNVVAIDLDGDNDNDVLLATHDNDTVAWYENLGGGTFGPQQVLGRVVYVLSVHSADLDGDGDNDVLTASAIDDKVIWYENLGLGTFGPEQVLTTQADGPRIVYTKDFDGDGDPDVFSLAIDNIVSWHENLGGGSFGARQIINDEVNMPSSIVVEDIDNDGNLDVVVADIIASGGSPYPHGITWFMNLGNGNFDIEQVVGSSLFHANDICTGDFDGDGDIDVLAAGTGDSRLAWSENLGNGVFTAQQVIRTDSVLYRQLKAADFDGDGDLDFTGKGALQELNWVENLGNGNFGAFHVIASPISSSGAIEILDVDADGQPDIAFSHDDRLVWYENLGGGNFGPENLISDSLTVYTSMHAADLDGDMDLDLVMPNYTDERVIWFENLGNGNFGPEITVRDFIDVLYVSAADLDGDGDLDLLSTSVSGVAWYENLGGGNFGTYQTLSVTSSRGIYGRDIDGDGDSDVLMRIVDSNGTTGIAWLENLGAGVFAPEVVCYTDLDDSYGFALEDLDGNGGLDVLSFSYDASEVVWNKNLLYYELQIHGRVFYDVNQNGIHDSLDIGLGNTNVGSIPQSDYSFSQSSGHYFMNFSDTLGTYHITPPALQYLSVVTDSLSYTIQLDSTFSVLDSLDFGFYPDTVVNEVQIDLTGDLLRCNSIINYWLSIDNTGSSLPSGVLELNLHDSLTYVGSSFPPDSIVGQQLYWSYDTLFYFERTTFPISLQSPGIGMLGVPMLSYLKGYIIDTVGNTIYTSVDTLYQDLMCAYDPNDKIVTPAGIDEQGYIPPATTMLEYTIRFQNTGNDTAINVFLRDLLDPNLDWTSVTPVASSHPLQLHSQVDLSGEVTFSFFNIMLPDSNVNELASHGFVKFHINLLPNLPLGTTITNTSYIYFDANPAVITNTTMNTLYECPSTVQNVISTVACENEVFAGSSSDNLSTTIFSWDLAGMYNQLGSAFSWTADTSGTFDLTITATNEFCVRDTVIQITVIPELSIQLLDTSAICMGDSALIFGQYQTQPGVYYDSLQTMNGCDSIVGNQLDVLQVPVTTVNAFLEICVGDSLLIFGQYQTQSGVYYDSLQAINGCDSIVGNQLDVLQLPVDTVITMLEICIGDSVLIFGQYQTQSGVYYDSLQTINGCDSTIGSQLEVLQLPVVTVSPFLEDTVCIEDGMLTLPVVTPTGGIFSGNGVSNNQFDPNSAGTGTHQIYYLYADQDGCTSSDSVTIVVQICAGISEIDPSNITIYPNPFIDFTTLNFGEPLHGVYNLKVTDVLGKEVYSKLNVTGSEVLIQQKDWGSGIFLLSLINYASGKIEFTSKLVVE